MSSKTVFFPCVICRQKILMRQSEKYERKLKENLSKIIQNQTFSKCLIYYFTDCLKKNVKKICPLVCLHMNVSEKNEGFDLFFVYTLLSPFKVFKKNTKYSKKCNKKRQDVLRKTKLRSSKPSVETNQGRWFFYI